MRPTGSPDELERRRLRALALLGEGLLRVEAARRVGADRRSVRRRKAAARRLLRVPWNTLSGYRLGLAEYFDPDSVRKLASFSLVIRFDSYMAASACLRSCTGCVPSSGNRAMPMLARSGYDLPRSSNG